MKGLSATPLVFLLVGPLAMGIGCIEAAVVGVARDGGESDAGADALPTLGDAWPGEEDEVPVTAPSVCMTSATCPAGHFCWRPDGVCSGVWGGCVPTPQTCPPDVSVVCGCDGYTYASLCFANQARVSVMHDGGCP
jgi:hypothetical protein